MPFFVLVTAMAAAPTAVELNAPLSAYISSLAGELERLPAERRARLDELASYVRKARANGGPARLLFICTHNSRRSHMSQLFAAMAAAHAGVGGVETYSGGTEATAFNPRAVAALERAGFTIEKGSGENPRYTVRFAPGAPALVAFSKRFVDPPNPTRDFAAVLTCSQADEACPIVKGATLRVSLPYLDPKAADGTPDEARAYDERARQIATEMLYLFSRV